jgi:hypothetical protein
MKKFAFIILTIFSFLLLPAYADNLPIRDKFEQSKSSYSNKYSVVKFFQEHVNFANNVDLTKFSQFYSPEYINNDGFNSNIAKNILEDLSKQRTDIKYKNFVNTVSFYGDFAIVNVTETATAKITNDTKKKGTLKSCTNVIYYLKRSSKNWIIISENVISEEINMIWGDAKYVAMFMEAPQQVGAGTEYSARIFIAPPTGLMAIGSISSEIVSYPQKQQKDTFRKFSPDYSLERLLIANSDNVNEYAIATVAFTPTNSRNTKDNITGYACLIRRVNVVPKNKFIEEKKTDNVTLKK